MISGFPRCHEATVRVDEYYRPLLPHHHGGKVTHMSTEFSTLSSDINKARVLSPTAAGKATATVTAGFASDIQRRLVAN